MAQIAKGHVADRPFARTVYALLVKRFTGELVLEERGKRYRVGFESGAVVAAESAAASDALGRIALAAKLVTGDQLSEVLRLTTRGGKSELEALTEIGQLTAEQLADLRAKTFARKAMRIFALPDASFHLDDQTDLQPEAQPLDIRYLTYRGVRLHYDQARIERELRTLIGAASFQLREAAIKILGAFGFGAGDKQLLGVLRADAHDVPMLTGRLRDPKHQLRALAIVYALAAADCLTLGEPLSEPAEPAPAPKPEPKARPAPSPAPKARPAPPTRHPAAQPPAPPSSRPSRPATPPASRAPAKPAPAAAALSPELDALIRDKLALIDRGADHFTLLGVTPKTPPNQLQAIYFDLAKKLHPDRLRAEGAASDRAETVFAVVNQAFAVLSNPDKRAEYEAKLDKGTDDADAQRKAMQILAAEEAFILGEMALKRGSWADAAREFGKAVELNPDEGEHHAYFAWATWCAASDKEAVAKQVRSSLRTAIRMSPKSAPAYFFRGQIAKQQGQMETAEDCFSKVLDLDPSHREAETELRLLRTRSEKSDKKGGLFGRLKR